MADVKFGPEQISKPTPANINKIVRILTVSGAIFMAWMATANIVGPHTKDVLNQVIGLLLGLSNGLAPLFGVQVSGTVPAKDVTAIETK